MSIQRWFDASFRCFLFLLFGLKIERILAWFNVFSRIFDIFSIRQTFEWHYLHLMLNNEHASIVNVAIAFTFAGLFIRIRTSQLLVQSLTNYSFFYLSTRSNSSQNANISLSPLINLPFDYSLLLCIERFVFIERIIESGQ